MSKEVCDENAKNTSFNAEKGKGGKNKHARYECLICHAIFPLHGRYKQHMVKHSDARPFKCTVCEKTFKRMSEMNNHMQIHSNVTYTCDLCGLISKNRVSLRTHVRRVHKRDLRHRCEQCGKGFMSNYDLEDHKTSHLGIKNFICDYCGNAYLQKSYLAAHKRVIHGVQKYPASKQHRCDRCNKSFASELNLRNHTSLHSQTFLCAQCGKKFTSNYNLKLHERMHTGEGPYQCKLCSKAFWRSVALELHELTHAGKKPYECDICRQTFTRRSSMMGHRRKRHPDVSYPPPPLLLSQLELIRKTN